MFNDKKGISILGIVILALIVILVLGYFKISVKSVVESPVAQENVSYVKGASKNIWTAYLEKPVNYLWHDVWLDIFWKGFISNMERIRDGKPTDFDNASKSLQVEQSKNR